MARLDLHDLHKVRDFATHNRYNIFTVYKHSIGIQLVTAKLNLTCKLLFVFLLFCCILTCSFENIQNLVNEVIVSCSGLLPFINRPGHQVNEEITCIWVHYGETEELGNFGGKHQQEEFQPNPCGLIGYLGGLKSHEMSQHVILIFLESLWVLKLCV